MNDGTATNFKPTITTATHIHDDIVDCLRYLKDYSNEDDCAIIDKESTVLTEEKLELMGEAYKIMAKGEVKLPISTPALKAARKLRKTKAEYRTARSSKINPNSRCPCGSGKKFKKCKCSRKVN